MSFLWQRPAWLALLGGAITCFVFVDEKAFLSWFGYGLAAFFALFGPIQWADRWVMDAYISSGYGGGRHEYEVTRFDKAYFPYMLTARVAAGILGCVLIAIGTGKATGLIG